MKILGQKLNRRFFLNLFSLSAITTFIPAKVFGISDYRRDKNIPKQYVQNRDRPGFFIRSANPFMGVAIDEWGLSIRGMVENPIALRYEDLFEFKIFSQVSRLKCVECWSATAKWEGFLFQEVINLVKPDPKAKYVYFQSADSYYESYSLKELVRPRVLMVLRMDGQPLSKDHGFPLRLIAPFKYGYKSVKELKNMERYAFRKFYLRPSYIFKRIMKIRSFEDIKRYIKGGTALVQGFL